MENEVRNEIPKKKKFKTSPFFVIVFIVLALYTLSLIIPSLWTLLTSVKDPSLYKKGTLKVILGIPTKFSFKNFSNAYNQFYIERMIGENLYRFEMGDMFLNSLIYSAGCALAGTLTPCITAYLVARYRYRFGSFLYALVIVVMALPVVGSLPSEIQVTKALHLYDSFIGLFIMKANFLGVYFLVFHAQFKSIPYDYTEAAKMDGASNFRVMVQIIMPLAIGTISTVFLMLFIQYWNDYQIPMIYLDSKPVIAYGLFEYSRSTNGKVSNTPTKLAGIVMTALPILVFFAIFSKKLMVNVSVGGIKG